MEVFNADHPNLYITGLASEYPPHLLKPDAFEEYLLDLCGQDIENPGIQKLLAINRATGIETRSVACAVEDPVFSRPTPLPINELSQIFREVGVDLTVTACKRALTESGLSALDITHIVAVTCTDAGHPGYDLLVAQKLGLRENVDRTLLHGVGCAGGLAALRTAANLAYGAVTRRSPARILVFACELCSIHIRCDINHTILNPDDTRIGSALFSDGAAAVILSNGLAPEAESKSIFTLLDCGGAVIPDSFPYMAFTPDPLGFRVTLTREVAERTVQAITPMWKQLRGCYARGQLNGHSEHVEAPDCDWALHPGGMAILKGVKNVLQLSDDHIRASLEIYKSRGNSSSPTVLIVLDRLRQMSGRRDKVVAATFGPGLCIEMITMKLCRKALNTSVDGEAVRP